MNETSIKCGLCDHTHVDSDIALSRFGGWLKFEVTGRGHVKTTFFVCDRCINDRPSVTIEFKKVSVYD